MKRLYLLLKEKVATEFLLLVLRSNIESVIFYILILLLPTQLGRHFWPKFSFVSGIRVDYLSPTIYLTDILVLLLFIAWILKKKFSIFNSQFSMKFKFQIGSLITFILVGIILSKNPLVGLYGIFKLTEFTFLGFYTASNINKLNLGNVLSLFSIGIIFEFFLSITQYLHKGSISGIFYLFGERTFNSQTPGIANASINGELFLRPYGTFSHPNVLAGYLIIAMTMIIMNQESRIKNYAKALYIFSLIAGTLGLLLTMSRIGILLWLVIIGLKNFQSLIHSSSFTIRLLAVLVFIGSICSIFIFSPLHSRFTNIRLSDESVVEREALIKDSLLMLKDSPVFGVGLNNFLVNLPNYAKSNRPLFYLQPVHNIYLLILAQTGIVGLVFFVWFIGKTYKRIMNQESPLRQGSAGQARIKNRKSIIHNSKFIILSTVLILGLFDHYFLTLQQGQLLFSFILGLCWANSPKRNY